MTRERNTANGMVTPPPLHRWMHAVLLLFATLTAGVRATFGMIFNRKDRDWHTAPPQEALPQTKPDIQLKEPDTLTKSFPGSTRESFFASTREHVARKKDARAKPGHDSLVDAATPTPVIPGAGALAPKTRNPEATRIDISTSRFWLPALRGFAAPAGMTVQEPAT